MNWLERGVRNEIGAIKGVDVFGSEVLRWISRDKALCHITVWFKSAYFQVTETSLELMQRRTYQKDRGVWQNWRAGVHLVSWEGKRGTRKPLRTQACCPALFHPWVALCRPPPTISSSDVQFTWQFMSKAPDFIFLSRFQYCMWLIYGGISKLLIFW